MENTSAPAHTKPIRRGIHAAGIIVAVALLGACSIGGPSDEEKALKYAQKACDHVRMDGTPSDGTGEGELTASEQADLWQEGADNAARAARLDPAWNELARATDAQYRAWSTQARGPALGELQPLLDQATAHPFEPECRKALVK